MRECRFPVPFFSVGLYLLARMAWQPNKKDSWIKDALECANQMIGIVCREDSFRLSQLNAILFVCAKLYCTSKEERKEIREIVEHIAWLIPRCIGNNPVAYIDALSFAKIVSRFPSDLRLNGEEQLLGRIRQNVSPMNAEEKTDYIYEHVWWGILYDFFFEDSFYDRQWEKYLEQKTQDAHYDERMVNSRLAGWGLQIMSKYNL